MAEEVDVVVVGSCMTDLVRHLDCPKLERQYMATISLSASAKEQTSVSRLLGSEPRLRWCARLEKDFFGSNYIQNFKDNAVCTAFVTQTAEAMTGAASIIVNDAGENAIVIVAGANMLLGEEELEQARSSLAKAKVLLCQLEISSHISLQALRIARQSNVKTIFNPAPAIPDLHTDFYRESDIFCCNESEAELLTGTRVASVDDAGHAGLELLKRGCAAVIITLGPQGCVVLQASNPNPKHIPTTKVTPVDTTGAGDSFMGALGLLHGALPVDVSGGDEQESKPGSFSVCAERRHSNILSVQEGPGSRTVVTHP